MYLKERPQNISNIKSVTMNQDATLTKRPRACRRCRARKLRCDRQSPCGSCTMRGWDCVAQVPKIYPRRITKSTRQADHWNEFLANLDHGRDNIFDFIYGVDDRENARPVKQTEKHHANQIAESDDSNTPETPKSCSGSEIEDSGGSTPNDDPSGEPVGFAIQFSDRDEQQWDFCSDPSLYRLAAEIVRDVRANEQSDYSVFRPCLDRFGGEAMISRTNFGFT